MSEENIRSVNAIWKQNKLIRIVVVFLGTYFFFRYIFTLIAPFALAFLLISLIYPVLQRMQNKIPVKKKFLGFLLIIPVFLIITGIFWFLMASGGNWLYKLPDICSDIGVRLEVFFHRCCCELDGMFGWDGEEVEQYIVEQMTIVMENVQVQVLPQMLASSYSCFKAIFSVIAFLAITCIAVFLMETEYAAMVSWLKSSEEIAVIWKVVEGVMCYIITFIKAQGVILLLISILCCVVLGAAGVEGGIFWGLLAGCLDVLPFIGTGIVLVPLTIWQLINGCYGKMAACLILYGACALLREWLEPKLIGKRIGIAPVFMLLAVYAGVKLFGVSGIVKGPLSLIVIYEIMREEKASAQDLTNKKRERMM